MTQQSTPKQAPDINKLQLSWEYIGKMKPADYQALPRELQLRIAHWMIENSGKRK